MAKAPVDIRSLARAHTDLAINTLAGIARCGESEPARVAASVALLDRGWGKPATTHTGPDGEGDIRVTIRHIIHGGRADRAENVLELRAAAPPVEVLPAPGGDQ